MTSPPRADAPPEPGNELAPLPEASAWTGLRSFLRETLETIALTLVIFVVIRAGVQNFRIEGFSMEPNFHDGQYLLVNKVEYLLHPPERGDVVVFRSPQNLERDFIKRVIGLPGESVEIREGRVLIDGQALTQTYNVNPASYNYGPAKVGPDQLFVLGDNRNSSSDSHSWGMLPHADVIGRAWLSYWPPEHWGVIQTPSFASAAPAPPEAGVPAATPLSNRTPAYP
ncbi:MAG: signal peptidase I [Chloroflexi bacterium]|nr:signal peptidase I [Chloroflexota bacterium]